MPSQKVFKDIIIRILTGVQYLNNAGICHNDLNEKNIMINPKNFSVKIIDYDFSSIGRINNCYDNSSILNLVSQYGHVWGLSTETILKITKPFRK